MIEQFIFWLCSIVEDNPIPYEINHISFVYRTSNKCISLAMGGTEYKPTLNNLFDYFPLEAQFFDCLDLLKISNINYYHRLLAQIINESFSVPYLKHQFKDRAIYLGEYGKSMEFLFNVKNF